MSAQKPPIDPLEALKHIRVLLRVAADSGDLEQIEKRLAQSQAIIDAALSRKKPADQQ